MATAYTVLGLERTATQEQIATAYRAKALEHHPDRGGDQARMAKINLAWQKLGSEEARRLYDAHLLELERAAAATHEETRPESDAFADRLRSATVAGADVATMLGQVGGAAGLERMQAAAKKGGEVAQGLVDLISLVRGHS